MVRFRFLTPNSPRKFLRRLRCVSGRPSVPLLVLAVVCVVLFVASKLSLLPRVGSNVLGHTDRPETGGIRYAKEVTSSHQEEWDDLGELDEGVPEEENVAREDLEAKPEEPTGGLAEAGAQEVMSTEAEHKKEQQIESQWLETPISEKKNEAKEFENEKLGQKISSRGLSLAQIQPTYRNESSVLQTSDTKPISKRMQIFEVESQNWRNLNQNDISSMSTLGRRLFLYDNLGRVQSHNFTILVWKHGEILSKRLIHHFGKAKQDPFRGCSTRNCRLTYQDEDLTVADAVLFHLHRTPNCSFLPKRTRLDQRWVWLSDESPYNTLMSAKNKSLAQFDGLFNWSMSYRMESDVPVPYGRTLPLDVEMPIKVNYHANKHKLVSTVGSNCGNGRNYRWKYVKNLGSHIQVDIYGRCGTLKCQGHYDKECKPLDMYKFYLAFENSNCKEYLTEKVWWSALKKGSVPIVMGTVKEDYTKILPPNSFIHVDDFEKPQDLAEYIKYLAANATAYNQYHNWRSKYSISNEHGYFGSPSLHYCRLCEALNYNDPVAKVYDHLEQFWNKEKQCYPPKWKEPSVSQKPKHKSSSNPEHKRRI